MKITDRIRYAFWLGWWSFKQKYMTPLENAQQALAGLAQAVNNAKTRHSQGDTQITQLKGELVQQQTRAQAAENALAAVTAELQKHIATINAS